MPDCLILDEDNGIGVGQGPYLYFVIRMQRIICIWEHSQMTEYMFFIGMLLIDNVE